jgi:hypothetical protein
MAETTPTQGQMIDAIKSAIPLPEQTSGWDLSNPKAVIFKWRGDRFKAMSASSRLLVMEGAGSDSFIISNKAILLEALLNTKGE